MSTLSSCRFEELSFYRLLTCLEEIRHKLEDREDDFILCSSYFQSRDFRKYFQFPTTASSSPDRILCSDEELTAPGLQNSKRSLEIAQEIVDTLLPCSPENTEGQELQHILTKPHVKGLLQAHDAVAAGDVPSISVRDEVTDILGANLFGAADNSHHNDGSFPGDNDSTKHANVTHNFIDSKEQEAWNKANQVDSFPTKNIPEETRTSIEDECVILKDIRKETDLDQEHKGRKKEKISFSSKAISEQNIEAQVTTGSENATKTVTLFRNAKETLDLCMLEMKFLK
ncbi:hypothetical protein P5673_015437 [Acropora cervicornis]|uniref:L27 domain-containing protein n=1 Tax=Acropora cervicornis TaxID=6130 RepID=A0AAD9V503_ACRCE|nr:hypothetical protein P5673_015437 [Acropora cervicornis]